jgi:hypothetical protein
MFANTLTKIAIPLVTLSFLGTPAFAQDAMSCLDGRDTGSMKTRTHQTGAEASDTDGNYLGQNRRFVWGTFSYSQYLSDDVWVEVSCDLDSNCTVQEDGETMASGTISSAAAELILRINHQMRISTARVPEAVVNTSVTWGMLWSGAAPVLEGCSLDAWNAPYFN